MLADLHAVLPAGAVDQELVVDVDGNVVNVHPAFALARATAPNITAVFGSSARIIAGKENEVTRLELCGIGEQHAHFLTGFRHVDKSHALLQ